MKDLYRNTSTLFHSTTYVLYVYIVQHCVTVVNSDTAFYFIRIVYDTVFCIASYNIVYRVPHELDNIFSSITIIL